MGLWDVGAEDEQGVISVTLSSNNNLPYPIYNLSVWYKQKPTNSILDI